MNLVFYKQQLRNYMHAQKEQGSLWWLWFVMLPIVPLLAYMSLGFLRILPVTDGIPRHIFIVIGMTSWLLFTDAIIQPFRSIARNRAHFIRQEISFTHLLSAWLPERLLTATLQFTFCLVIVYVVMPYNIVNVAGYAVIIAAAMILFLSIGAALAVVGLVSPSVTNLVEISNRFLLFLSGVVFPLPNGEFVDVIKVANPYYVFVDNARLALVGMPVDWFAISCWTGFGILTVLFLKARLSAITPDVRDYLS